jgi:hypothetical protein
MIGLVARGSASLVSSISGPGGYRIIIQYRTRLDSIVPGSDNCHHVSLKPMFANLKHILNRLLAEYDVPQVLEHPP